MRLAKRLRMLGVGADIGLTVVLQGLSAVVAFAFQMVFLRELPKEDSGIYFLVITYITLAGGLGDFGIVATTFPRLSVARGAVTPAFKAAIVLRIATLALAWLLLNLYLVIAGRQELILYANLAYISVLVSSKATGIRQLFEVLWRLKGRTYLLTAISVIDGLIGLAAIAILAHFGELTVFWLIVIFSLSNLPGFIAIVLPLMKSLRSSGIFSRRIPMRYYRTLFAASLPVAIMVVTGQTSAQLETLVIDNTVQMSPADIAAYNAGIRPLTGLIFIATTIGFGLAPIVSQHSKGVRSDYSFEFIASVGLRVIGVISLGLCLVCGLFGPQIMRLFGAQYVGEAYILQIYSVISALTFMVVMHDQFLLAIGKRAQTLQGALLYLALALLTEPLMIRWFGIRGMMYAKGLAICCLIVFQLSRFSRGVRVAAAKGIARLLPSGAVLLGAILLTADLSLPLRVPIVAMALAGSLLAFRTVTIAELKALRAMRVT